MMFYNDLRTLRLIVLTLLTDLFLWALIGCHWSYDTNWRKVTRGYPREDLIPVV